VVAHRRAGPRLGERSQHVEAVLGVALRQRHMENARERRQHVGEADDLVAHRARGDSAGPANDERLPETAFPLGVLAAAQRTVDRQARTHGRRCGLVARIRHAAVVAGENDQRIVGQLELVELFDDLPHAPVQFLDEIAVLAVGAAGKSRIRRDGLVHGDRRIVHEEPPVVISLKPGRHVRRQRLHDPVGLPLFPDAGGGGAPWSVRVVDH